VMISGVSEIEEYKGDNSYSCGLEQTLASIYQMIQDVQNDFFSREEVPPDDGPYWASPRFLEVDNRKGFGAFPEVVFNLAISPSAGGMGVSVYKLIDFGGGGW